MKKLWPALGFTLLVALLLGVVVFAISQPALFFLVLVGGIMLIGACTSPGPAERVRLEEEAQRRRERKRREEDDGMAMDIRGTHLDRNHDGVPDSPSQRHGRH